MHGSRQELDDNEQQIQPRTKQERGGPAWYGNVHPRGSRAPGAVRSGGVPVTNVEGAASFTILMSAAQLQGESSVTDPPFFPNADRGTVPFWWKEQGR